MEHRESCREHFERAHYPGAYDEQRFCTAVRSIDTVKALHQTVVSLRTALDESRQEIDKLKKQITVNSEIQDAKHQQHILEESTDQTAQNINFQTLSNKVSELEKLYQDNKSKSTSVADDEEIPTKKTADDFKQSTVRKSTKFESSVKNDTTQTISLKPDITFSTNPSTSGATGANNWNSTMASRIDVKIKVSSNINIDDTDTTDTSEISDSPKPEDESHEESREEPSNADDLETPKQEQNPTIQIIDEDSANTFTVEGSNVIIKVTSEDTLNVTKSIERICLQQSSSEYLNLDIDDLSEGDNSVFTEGATTPIEQRMQQVEDVDTDNEAADNLKDDLDKEAQDNQEEVNNIELIFSSDDNKDLTQEDLVSISEYEPWQEAGGSGTPVLMNFNSLSSEDRNREFLNERKLTGSRFCSKPRSKCQSLDLQPGPNLRDKSLESTESLSFDINNKPNSMQSSLDKDSSIENPISRDVSMDTFEIQPNGTLNKKWTNFNVVIETDISKVGIGDNEGILDLGRRNTCPNPPIYRPIIHSQNRQSSRNPIAVKFTRSPRGFCPVLSTKTSRFEPLEEATGGDGKSSSAAQTDISAVPLQWRSEQHLTHSDYSPLFTLPTPHHPFNLRGRNALRLRDRTQESRRILLSDINFTSMVPELSRSADHLCQQRINEEVGEEGQSKDLRYEAASYNKGKNTKAAKTTEYVPRGITPSFSMTSPGVSQWTVSTTQTEGFWCDRGDSFDSTKSFSMRSGHSTGLLSKQHRSRSVPSIKCAICRLYHAQHSIRPSESMNYGQSHRVVTFQEPTQKNRGSLPDLRHDCTCPRRFGQQNYLRGYSSGSTESLLEEADEFLYRSREDQLFGDNDAAKRANRRCSENDIQRDFLHSKQSLPFLPRSPKCLKPGFLAKVISKNGRVVIGKIRYVGPLAASSDPDECFVGLQLTTNSGDSDGTVDGKKFFDCEANFGTFVQFKKVVMVWSS